MADAPNAPSKGTKPPRPGVRSLPAAIRRTFSDEFIPSVLEEVGWSTTPWENPNVKTLQICMSEVYPTIEYVVEKGDTIETSVGSPLPSACIPTLNYHIGKWESDDLPQHDWRRGVDKGSSLLRVQGI